VSEARSSADTEEVKAATPSRAILQRAWSRFLLVALALHIPLFFYPILRLCYWLGFPWWLTALIFFPLAGSQVVTRLYLRGKHSWWAVAYRRLADFWLGLSPMALIGCLVAELLVATTPASPRVAALAVICAIALVGAIGVATALRPFVKKISLVSSNLAAPVRFVQITDVHIGSRSSGFLEDVIARVNRLEPDFLCITGDFIDASGIAESRLKSLRSVTCPIYFCIGNHEKYEDLEDIMARLGNLGVKVLRNAATRFRDDLQVIGIDDLDDAHQVERQLRHIEVDRQGFALLLYHRPRGLEAAAAAGIDLMLSGHTHNGQIIPFNYVVRRVFDRAHGLHEHGGAKLYVSQGTGTWGPVMRVGTRSEITLFEVSPAAV
jgi:predicted MPP superfamily phosphohydrolase